MILSVAAIGTDEPQIGNMNEGVVEGGEDTGNTEDELTWGTMSIDF